jgi:hypothetical protein
MRVSFISSHGGRLVFERLLSGRPRFALQVILTKEGEDCKPKFVERYPRGVLYERNKAAFFAADTDADGETG